LSTPTISVRERAIRRGAVLGAVGTGCIVSLLQVWTYSGADPIEVGARPVVLIALGVAVLRGYAWARWTLLVPTLANALWFARTVWTRPALILPLQVACTMAAVLTVASAIALVYRPRAEGRAPEVAS
jgi:hypothetical protein